MNCIIEYFKKFVIYIYIVVTLVSLILRFQILFLRFINKNVFATKELFMSVYSNVKKSNSTSYTRVQRPKTIAQNSYHM